MASSPREFPMPKVVVDKLEVTKSKSSFVTLFQDLGFVLNLKLQVSDHSGSWEVKHTFPEVGNLVVQLKRENGKTVLPPCPAIPKTAAAFKQDTWQTFFDNLISNPDLAESGTLRTFIAKIQTENDLLQKQLGDVMKDGVLLKRKKGKKRTQQYRWAVLRNRMMIYYKSSADTTPLGLLWIDEYTVQASAKKNEKLKFNLLKNNEIKYTCIATTEQDRAQWITAIENENKKRDAARFRVEGTLHVEILEGANLAAKDINGYSDPFAILSIEHQQHRTLTIQKTLNPVWGEAFDFEIQRHSSVLRVLVWDEDRLKPPDFLGFVMVPLDSLKPDVENDFWMPVCPQKSKQLVRGQIHLRIFYRFQQVPEPEVESEPEPGKTDKKVKVFGRPPTVAIPIPLAIKTAMDFVQSAGVEGIYRVSGEMPVVNALRKDIDSGKPIKLELQAGEGDARVHAISGVIKLWLRELPEPVMTFDLYHVFLAAYKDSKSKEALLSKLLFFIKELPAPNKALLKELLAYLVLMTTMPFLVFVVVEIAFLFAALY